MGAVSGLKQAWYCYEDYTSLPPLTLRHERTSSVLMIASGRFKDLLADDNDGILKRDGVTGVEVKVEMRFEGEELYVPRDLNEMCR
jgi:hypothetical protein